MFGPDVLVQQPVSLLRGIGEHRLGFVAERHFVRLRRHDPTCRPRIDFAAHVVYREIRAREHAHRW